MGSSYFYNPSLYVERPFGWYSLDNSPEHGPMRWSGPGLLSGFDLPCPTGKNLQVSFRILMALQPDIIDRLSLKANNISVGLQYNIDSEGPLFLQENSSAGNFRTICAAGFFCSPNNRALFG
jgi:hypothetical protein